MPTSPFQIRTTTTSRQVQQVVANRSVIDQAKGVLILRFRVDAEGAFEILRNWAEETNSTPLLVAQTLVHGVCLEDTTRPWDPVVLSYVSTAFGQPPPERQRRVPRPRPRWAE